MNEPEVNADGGQFRQMLKLVQHLESFLLTVNEVKNETLLFSTLQEVINQSSLCRGMLFTVSEDQSQLFLANASFSERMRAMTGQDLLGSGLAARDSKILSRVIKEKAMVSDACIEEVLRDYFPNDILQTLMEVSRMDALQACVILPVTRFGAVTAVLAITASVPLDYLILTSSYLAAQISKRIELIRHNEELAGELRTVQSYIDIAEVMIVCLDRPGKITMLNQKGYEMLGIAPGEAAGLSWVDTFIPERERETVRKVLESIMNGTTSVFPYYENRILTAAGEEKLIRFHNSIVKDAAGIITGTISAGEDITAQRELQEKIKLSEDKFKYIFENAPDAYYICDMLGAFIDGNRAAEQLIGYHKEELIGKSFFKLGLLPLEYMPMSMKLLAINALGKSTGPDELFLVRKDGSRVNVEITTYPTVLSGKKIILGIARDISLRKKASRDRDAHQQQLRVLADITAQFNSAGSIDALLDIVMTYARQLNDVSSTIYEARDGKLRVRRMHPRITAMLETFESFGKMLTLDMGDIPLGHPRNVIARAYREQTPVFSNSYWDFMDGTPVMDNPALKAATEIIFKALQAVVPQKRYCCLPIGDFGVLTLPEKAVEGSAGSDHIMWLLSVINQASVAIQRERAKQKQEELRMQLAESQKMDAMGKLASGICHDFNNHLTAISGFAQMLLLSLPEAHAGRDDVQEILKASSSSAALISQLMAFSRKQALSKEPADINALIFDTMAMLRRLIRAEIEIRTDLSKNIPIISADPGQLRQVLINLMVNAQDACAGTGTITITTRPVTLPRTKIREPNASDTTSFLELSVRDTGAGIAPEDISHIFEPFFTTKAPGKGTGLGLPVIYGILKQHEGWVEVESTVGRGTTFRILLPSLDRKETGLGSKEQVQNQAPQGGGQSILVVEDEESVGKFLLSLLRKSNYEAVRAATARAAMEAFAARKGGFDLLLCDIVLPDLNGLDLVENLLAQKPSLKVIMTSGYLDNQSRGNVLKKRDLRFVQKPFNLNELLGAVETALKK